MAEDKGKSREEKRAEEPVTGLAPGQDPATQSGKGQKSGGTVTGASGVDQAAAVPNPAASAQGGADDPKRSGAGRESTGGARVSTGTVGGQPIDPDDSAPSDAAHGGQDNALGSAETVKVRDAMAADRVQAGGEDQRSDAAKAKAAKAEEKPDAAKAEKPDAAKGDAGKQGEAGKDGKPGEDAKGDDSGKGGAGGQGGAGGAGGRPGTPGMGQPRRNT